jgi:hypothetical protein
LYCLPEASITPPRKVSLTIDDREPEEIARCVVLFACNDARLIASTTLAANGGRYFA